MSAVSLEHYRDLCDSYYESCAQSSFSKACSYGAKRTEDGWRLFQLAEDVSRAVMHCFTLKGQHGGVAARASNAAQNFATIASMISAVRFIFAWEKLISLKMFFYKDKEGETQWQDWMLIVVNICLLVARSLSPLLLLHNLKVMDLGKHAKAMGTTLAVAFSGVVVFYFAYCVKDIADTFNGENQEKYWTSVRECIGAFLDLIALPCQFVPAYGIAGCVISGLSGIFHFIQRYNSC